MGGQARALPNELQYLFHTVRLGRLDKPAKGPLLTGTFNWRGRADSLPWCALYVMLYRT